MTKPVGLLPAAPTEARTPMFRSLAIAASGLSGQRHRMETIASNIANAETTHDVNGGPYRRRVTQLAAGDTPVAAGGIVAPGQPIGQLGAFNGVAPFQVPSGTFPTDGPRTFEVPVLETNGPGGGATGVHVAGVAEDTTSEGPLVYDPGHPDADKNGYVRYPNVRITDELVDLMDARHVYEANATVFQSAKAMLKQALDI
jgi:flagellar basal-body rod protein FlgC